MKHPLFRVNLLDVHFALREMAADLRDRKLWLAILGCVVLVALAGPFYTLETLGLLGRIAYWGPVGALSWLMLWALNRIIMVMAPDNWPGALIGALSGVVGVLPVMGLVALAHLGTGLSLPQAGFWGFIPYVAPPVVGISILAHMRASGSDRAPHPATRDAPNGLFSRLPPELGRDIIALHAQDHYVHVTTSKGSSLILMRMSDAVEDLRGLRGIQIHRSWWVSLNHVSHLEKNATGGVKLVLGNGISVPVPRSRQSEIRQAVSANTPR